MGSLTKAILLLLTLFFVGVLRSAYAFPAGGSRPAGRQTRFVHYWECHYCCGRRGFQADIQQTERTINSANRTLNIMRESVFRDPGYETSSAVIEEDTSLASLHRTLGTYNQALSTVTGEARDLEAYNDPLRRSMEHTEIILSNMLVKLQITLMRAEELDDVTVTEGPTVDPEETTYERQLRHLTIFQHLCETLNVLKQRLETRLAEC